MENLTFDYQLDEFMLFCRSKQLREKTLSSYEQTLRLFERWCFEELKIERVDAVTESTVRRYITNLMERGKYSFYANDKKKEINFPDRRRDFRAPVSITTINNYKKCLRCCKKMSSSLKSMVNIAPKFHTLQKSNWNTNK